METNRGAFFLKMNTLEDAPAMFATEARGLELLRQAEALRIPRVIAQDQVADQAFLLLEYIPPATPGPDFWSNFGRQLAALHRHTAPQFGLDHDNFIGSLVQVNTGYDTWSDFFQFARLQVQIDLALARQQIDAATVRAFQQLFKRLPQLCPAEPPALLHGDLWNGNFLVGKPDQAVLIDPAVHYGHREMDLAMTDLFGGFPPLFYQAYHEAFPLASGWRQRLPLYQLYYLMVHVNLFGGGYLRQVQGILRQFS